MDIKDKNGNILAKSIVSNQHNVEKNFHTKNDEEHTFVRFVQNRVVIFDNKLQRTINVDIRYVLWVIENFSGAKHIVDEMTIVK